MCLFFFFSSRRRHTRYWRDWSSDVCSSDLTYGRPAATSTTSRAESPSPVARLCHGSHQAAMGRLAHLAGQLVLFGFVQLPQDPGRLAAVEALTRAREGELPAGLLDVREPEEHEAEVGADRK